MNETGFKFDIKIDKALNTLEDVNLMNLHELDNVIEYGSDIVVFDTMLQTDFHSMYLKIDMATMLLKVKDILSIKIPIIFIGYLKFDQFTNIVPSTAAIGLALKEAYLNSKHILCIRHLTAINAPKHL